jgi:hypothetical protein
MKNIEFIGIRMAMDEMKKWAEENLDAPTSLPRMTGRNPVKLCNSHKLPKNQGDIGKGFKKFPQYMHKVTHNSHQTCNQGPTCPKLVI